MGVMSNPGTEQLLLHELSSLSLYKLQQRQLYCSQLSSMSCLSLCLTEHIMLQAKAMLDSGMNGEDMVNQEFEELYPGKVERTQIVYAAKVPS